MKANYELWLTVNENKDKIQIPVNPPSISISSGSKNSTVDVANLGEVTILQSPAAKTFEFSSFLPSTYGPYCEYVDIPNPWDVVNFIEKYKSSQPFRFIITNTPINYLVSIEDFKYDEQAGDVCTLNYSLQLKEYRIVKPRQITVVKAVAVAQPVQRPNPKPQPKTYTVVGGDYLIKIARKLQISDWRNIFNANKDKIKNPNVLQIGWVLKIS